MSLFERFHLTQDEAEARLKRPLTGDPTRGEIGLLASSTRTGSTTSRPNSRATTPSAPTSASSSARTSRRRASAGRPARPGPSRCRFRSGTSTPERRGSPAARSPNASSRRSGATTTGGRASSSRSRPWTRTCGPSTRPRASCWRRLGRSSSGSVPCRRSACGWRGSRRR